MDRVLDVRLVATGHAICQIPAETGQPANGEIHPAPGIQPKLNSSPKTATKLRIQRYGCAPGRQSRRSSYSD